ncbi:COP23 domain-containing protein [Cyanobium sp. BA20m-p-22]|uniref:COP23 domain-containing protein n=1 Tax=Cyanobium sp. BA20m-p-22 TaxID=2823704 RepID=UPI0020CB6FCF|nr:COP23 domain-containing protein [Cyanobium sp. BA20m-p-22]MCP9909900.1 COP23 domain-containing protein [Cyanobium sp. BA20m-p-22]
MGRVAVLETLAAACCVLAPGLTLQPAEAGVSARSFLCGSSSGAPATNVMTGDGRQVPVIRWTSSVFNDAGWSQQRRCQEVSSRFDSFLKQGRLSYITTGRMNGQPVICTARNKGGACDGLLFTLKPGQDATSTLKNLLEIRVKARGPLNETNSRLYVSLDELLSTAQANASSGAAPVSSPAPAQGNNALW